jgi:hypothetical protein
MAQVELHPLNYTFLLLNNQILNNSCIDLISLSGKSLVLPYG